MQDIDHSPVLNQTQLGLVQVDRCLVQRTTESQSGHAAAPQFVVIAKILLDPHSPPVDLSADLLEHSFRVLLTVHFRHVTAGVDEADLLQALLIHELGGDGRIEISQEGSVVEAFVVGEACIDGVHLGGVHIEVQHCHALAELAATNMAVVVPAKNS